jgi:hypothetical protein
MEKSLDPLIKELDRFLINYFGLQESGLIEIPRIFEGNKKHNLLPHSRKKETDMIILNSCRSHDFNRTMWYMEGAFKTYITMGYKQGDKIKSIDWIEKPHIIEMLDIEGNTLYQICLKTTITTITNENI